MSRIITLWLLVVCFAFLWQPSSTSDEVNVEPKIQTVVMYSLNQSQPVSIRFVKFKKHHNYHKHWMHKISNKHRNLKKLSKKLDNECGMRPIPYIANGRDAKPGEFPSYVHTSTFMRRNEPNSYDVVNCGGTILSPTHILTAAHCLHGTNTMVFVKPTIVAPNLKDPNVLQSMYQVATVCVSNKWRPEKPFKSTDLAVYRLKEPLKFNDTVQSACLPKRKIDKKTLVYQVGLGDTPDNTTIKPANILQVLQVKHSDCLKRYSDRICFKSRERALLGAVCKGDSGGPTLGKQDGKVTVFGVTHASTSPCRRDKAGDPSINMDTHFYRDHILKLIECSNKM